jgi:hypothetical protein
MDKRHKWILVGGGGHHACRLSELLLVHLHHEFLTSGIFFRFLDISDGHDGPPWKKITMGTKLKKTFRAP